jgi:hypothetical protein
VSYLTEQFIKSITEMVEAVEHHGSVPEVTDEILPFMDAMRRRLDRIQADPSKRPIPRAQFVYGEPK